MLKKIPLLIIVFFCDAFYSQNNTETPLDSVKKYIVLSDGIRYPDKKIKYLNKAFSFAKEINKHSQKNNKSSTSSNIIIKKNVLISIYRKMLINGTINITEQNIDLLKILLQKKPHPIF